MNTISTWQIIYSTFGAVGVILTLILIFFKYFSQKLNLAADSFIQQKGQNLATLQDIGKITKIQEDVKTQLLEQFKILFRDEDIRNSIASHTAIQSFDAITKVWRNTYSLYFEFQRLIFDSQPPQLNLILEFHKKIQFNTEDILLSQYFFSEDLTLELLNFTRILQEIVQKEYYNVSNIIHQSTDQFNTTEEYAKLTEIIQEIESWIASNLKTYKTVAHYELDSVQLAQLNELRSKRYEPLNSTEPKN